MRILVIGESCSDVYKYGDCTRLCPEAPVPVMKTDNRETNVNAGMAMNVYRNVEALSKDIVVDIITNNNWQQIKKIRYVDQKTNYIILRVDENDDSINRCKIKKINFEPYDIVIISDYNKGFLTREDIEYISKKHQTTFLDTKKILGKWCKDIKYIKINENEYDRTRHMIDSDLVSKLIITLGSNGARHLDKTYPVSKVEIKDTSGAGDTFIAGLCVKYLSSKNIDDSIGFANKCATVVVQKKGVSVV